MATTQDVVLQGPHNNLFVSFHVVLIIPVVLILPKLSQEECYLIICIVQFDFEIRFRLVEFGLCTHSKTVALFGFSQATFIHQLKGRTLGCRDISQIEEDFAVVQPIWKCFLENFMFTRWTSVTSGPRRALVAVASPGIVC
jgi:hypothetical protein